MHLNCDGARDVHGIVEERIWIGTSGWTYDSWRGRFYPRHIPKHSWLPWSRLNLPPPRSIPHDGLLVDGSGGLAGIARDGTAPRVAVRALPGAC
jgi:hypothetical protein